MCAMLVIYWFGMEAEGLPVWCFPCLVAVFFSDKQKAGTSAKTWEWEGVWRHEENGAGVC